ncbi:hypothetical protein AB0937_23060 [Streptomyces sp. NPDC047880]|uniref:helix-turn-helix domain-containing protein n=1 Tax=Streptomyces sp. NPDC047880 TaxID=3155626 RepID=UPI00345151BF
MRPGGLAGYFAFRSAAFGRASAELVISTFYNFPPVVRQAVDGPWETATPQQVLDARYAAAGEVLVKDLGGIADGAGHEVPVDRGTPRPDSATASSLSTVEPPQSTSVRHCPVTCLAPSYRQFRAVFLPMALRTRETPIGSGR